VDKKGQLVRSGLEKQEHDWRVKTGSPQEREAILRGKGLKESRQKFSFGPGIEARENFKPSSGRSVRFEETLGGYGPPYEGG
jgi:hypothetical protein